MSWWKYIACGAPVCWKPVTPEDHINEWRAEVRLVKLDLNGEIAKKQIRISSLYWDIRSALQRNNPERARELAKIRAECKADIEKLRSGVLLLDELYRALAPAKMLEEGQEKYKWSVEVSRCAEFAMNNWIVFGQMKDLLAEWKDVGIISLEIKGARSRTPISAGEIDAEIAEATTKKRIK